MNLESLTSALETLIIKIWGYKERIIVSILPLFCKEENQGTEIDLGIYS